MIGDVAERLRAAGVAEAGDEAERIATAAGDDPAQVDAIVRRRLAGEPLGLILGHSEFMGLRLHVAPGVLVPREETELLGSAAVEALRASGHPEPRAIDMCCGAGNLAVALGHHVPAARIWASDLTDACVETARRNVAEHGLLARVTVLQGDLFAPLAGLGLEGTIDLVACNPPYISSGRLEGDRAELLEHEPREAFDAGPYGLAIHQRVIRDALPFLKEGGALMFEFGEGQAQQLQILFRRARQYGDVRLLSDANGTDRVIIGRKAGSPS